MDDGALNRVMQVEEPQAVAALLDATLRTIVLSLAQRPRGLGELAAAYGFDLKRLHHHVTRLCRLGLVEVAGERRRAGRPIKIYRAASTAFLVPHAATPQLFTEEMARELREGLAAEAGGSGGGLFFGVDGAGQQVVRVERGPHPARGMEIWRILRLTAEERAVLTAEIEALFARYGRRTAGPGDPYLVHAAAAPQRGGA